MAIKTRKKAMPMRRKTRGSRMKRIFALTCLVLLLFIIFVPSFLEAKQYKKQAEETKVSAYKAGKKKDDKGTKQASEAENKAGMFGRGGYLQVVNKKTKIDKDYEPKDLVLPKVPTRKRSLSKAIYIRKQAGKELENMFLAAGVEKGFSLHAVSGFRSFGIQQINFSAKIKQAKSKAKAAQVVAPPGSSEHQTGLAMDIQAEGFNQLDINFEKRPEGKWLKENAHRFGFILRYMKDKEKITGFSYEPWHFRYVTRPHAGAIYKLGLCLEEYEAVAKKFPEYILQNATDKALIGLYNEVSSGDESFISSFEKSENKEESLKSFTQKYLDGESYENAYLRCFPERIPEKEAPKYEDEDVELFK